MLPPLFRSERSVSAPLASSCTSLSCPVPSRPAMPPEAYVHYGRKTNKMQAPQPNCRSGSNACQATNNKSVWCTACLLPA